MNQMMESYYGMSGPGGGAGGGNDIDSSGFNASTVLLIMSKVRDCPDWPSHTTQRKKPLTALEGIVE